MSLMHRLAVKEGQLVHAERDEVSRAGARSEQPVDVTAGAPQAIASLVEAGAIVVGPKPLGTPSLSDDESEYRRVVDELWGAGDGGGEHRHGSGVVHGNASLQDVLEAMKVLPDFTYTKPRADTNLLFVHRALDGRRSLLRRQSPRS